MQAPGSEQRPARELPLGTLMRMRGGLGVGGEGWEGVQRSSSEDEKIPLLTRSMKVLPNSLRGGWIQGTA